MATERTRDGSFIIMSCGGRVWMVKHATGEGKWSLPGGGVESGELAVRAAKREAEEELGTRAMIQDLIGVFHSRKNPGTHVFLYAGYVVVPGSVNKAGDGTEVAECRLWLPGEAIRAENVYPAQRLMVRAYVRWQRRHEVVEDWLSQPVTDELDPNELVDPVVIGGA